ncbi:GNAT family N-acetyltransferase [Patescibacteria group bacterium]|nr:GNAT family N-acetyltransferase [Patescibacteria group bacterium]
MNIKQSSPYLEYKRQLGWGVFCVSGINVIHKQSWYVGNHARIEQMLQMPNWELLANELISRKIRRISFEPASPGFNSSLLEEGILYLKDRGIHTGVFCDSPATKEIEVDILPDLDTIFSNFNSKKRHEIRRSLKNNFVLKSTSSMREFLRTQHISSGNRHLVQHHKVAILPRVFGRDLVPVVSAYTPEGEFLGASFSILWETTAYYWGVGVTSLGRKSLLSNLLLWEMLSAVKERGCHVFNIGGVWDERVPYLNKDWKGITYFKEGFGGRNVYLPLVPIKS